MEVKVQLFGIPVSETREIKWGVAIFRQRILLVTRGIKNRIIIFVSGIMIRFPSFLLIFWFTACLAPYLWATATLTFDVDVDVILRSRMPFYFAAYHVVRNRNAYPYTRAISEIKLVVIVERLRVNMRVRNFRSISQALYYINHNVLRISFP